MKKLLLVSLMGLLGISGTMAQTCPTTVSTFPHIQDFEGATTGSPGTLPAGWVMASTPTTSTYRWQVNAGPTGSSLTGPNIDHTLGTAAGKYVYTEASSGSAGNETELQTPCFNLTGLISPGFEFWYHMAGPGMGPMNIDVSTNNGTSWTNLHTFTGPQQTAESDPWLKKTISLAAYMNQTIKIRFKGTKIASAGSGFDFEGDMAIDDFKIFNIPAIDAELVAITAPAASSGCAFTSTENVTITIKNNGNAAISSIPVRFTLGTTIVNEVTPASLTIAPGATGSYTFTAKANLATAATYTLSSTVLLVGDGDPSNDAKSRSITVVPNVSTFPYFQNFESGNGGWVAGGANSSWALGMPAGPVINTAGSGTNSWVTNLTGDYNASENSQVSGPCFNMTTLVQPIISMKIWWQSEVGWDGAVLQSSINGGATWQNVGALNDPNNWYNAGTLIANPGGQPVGWAGNGTSGSGGWVTAKHALNGLGGQSSVLLRIAFAADGSIHFDGFAFDDVSIFESPANDVGIVALTSPVLGGCGFTTTENVCISIKNSGSTATTSFPVTYQIGTNPIVTETVTTPIAPGATFTYCFTTKANLAAGGTYNFSFTTALANDGDPSNNNLTSTIVNPLVSTFPHIQDFQTATVGAPGVLPAGWSTSPATGYRWEIEDGQPTSGTTTGPATDHTTGNATTGKYVYTESSSGVTGDITYLNSPCIDLAGLTSPGFDFWYHMHGATIGTMEAQVSSNGGTTWTTLTTLTGPQQTSHTDAWLKRTVSLAGYTGIVQIRFKGTRGSSFTSDMAIDDVKIYNIPATDAEVTVLTLPTSGCNLTNAENICMGVKNNSVTPISNISVNYTINGGTPVTEVIPGPIAPGTTFNYCFTTKANLSAANTYNIIGSVALTGDGDPSNNSKTGSITTVPSVATLPYTEGFENGNGGWVASGTNSSWVIGTPAKPVINTAGTGVNSYVTGLTGTYNASEVSQVLSPCFNFTGIGDPDFEMKAWWNSESGWDGAVLQSSINGGATWQNVGTLNAPNNWYNAGSLIANPGGQPIGWAGTGSASSGGWVRVKHKLTGLGGQGSVRLRIAFAADGSVHFDGFAFDDIRIGDNTNNLSINNFVPLTQLCGFGTNEKVEVVLENLGSTPVSGYTVSYTVSHNGGPASTPITVPGPSPLAANVPTNFVFPTGANLSAPGTYAIVVTVTNPNDPELSNNLITYNIANATFPGLPPIFNFETGPTGIAGLRLVTNSKSAITENVAGSRPLHNQPATSTKGMLMEGTTATGWIMPVGITDPWTNNPDHFSAAYICFTNTNTTAPMWLSFDLKQLFKTANANTNFRVTVNGNPIGGNTLNNNPANTYRPTFSGVGGTADWTKIYLDLDAYKSLPSLQIGFESSVAEPFAAGSGTANLVDNIRILRSNPTGTKDDVLQSNLNVFPNPSTGIFSVSVPTAQAYSLEVTDLTGKVIKTMEVKGNTQIDLKGNAQGVYMLKITSKDGMAVRKLIIE